MKITETSFTNLEKIVLRQILPNQAANDFFEPYELKQICDCISQNESEEISINTLKGVLGSLVKKRVLDSNNPEGFFHKYFYVADIFRDDQVLLDKIIEKIN